MTAGRPRIEWPSQAKARFEELWATDLSCKQIAAALSKEFGLDLTASSVTGQRNRLGLPTRPHPIRDRPKRLPRKSSGLSVSKSKDQRRLDTAPGAVRETDKRAELPARPKPASEPVLRPGSECQWTDSHGAPWVFCGATCQAGSSYCPEHHARVYMSATANGEQRKYTNTQTTYDIGSTATRESRKRFNKATDAKWGL